MGPYWIAYTLVRVLIVRQISWGNKVVFGTLFRVQPIIAWLIRPRPTRAQGGPFGPIRPGPLGLERGGCGSGSVYDERGCTEQYVGNVCVNCTIDEEVAALYGATLDCMSADECVFCEA